MKLLSLFSGCGGMDIGFEGNFKCLKKAINSNVHPDWIKDDDGTCGYVIKGGGYGHGIGMSQNAVSTMVKSGMTYREVLGFFFEGMDIMNVYDQKDDE